MGAFYMEASQINYRGGDHKMSVEEAIKGLGKSGITYATTEYDTNNKWVDGNEIYGIIVPITLSTSDKTTAVDLNLGDTATVISLRGIGYITNNSKDYAIDIPSGGGYDAPNTSMSLRYNATDKKLAVSGNNTSSGGMVVYVEVNYVKAVFPAPEPEPET